MRVFEYEDACERPCEVILVPELAEVVLLVVLR